MGNPQQVLVEVWGPEPIGSAQALGIMSNFGLSANGQYEPALIRGRGRMGGSEFGGEFFGDCGELQTNYTKIRTSGSRGTTRAGNVQALPGTSNGSGTVQSVLGAQGI
jgi:hypothetical protein